MKETKTEYLKFIFSEDEKKEMGGELARVFAEKTDAEARLKSVSTQIKGEVTALEGRMASLAEKIRSGYEFRNMECPIEYDYETRMVRIYRPDTGELVKERPMSSDELQMKMNLPPVNNLRA